MNCERFALWLDDGCPERDASEARRHARNLRDAVPSVDSVLSPALPWWVHAAREPAIVLSARLIAVLTAWGNDLMRGAAAAMGLLAGAMSGAATPGEWATLIADPRVAVAVGVALTPSLVWASRRLFAWGSKLAG